MDIRPLYSEEESMLLSVLLMKGNLPAETAQRPRKPAVEQQAQLFAVAPLPDTSLLSGGWSRVSPRRVSSLHLNTWSGAQLSALSPQLSSALSGPFGADQTAGSGKVQNNARSGIPFPNVFFSLRIFKQQKIAKLQSCLRPSHLVGRPGHGFAV